MKHKPSRRVKTCVSLLGCMSDSSLTEDHRWDSNKSMGSK